MASTLIMAHKNLAPKHRNNQGIKGQNVFRWGREELYNKGVGEAASLPPPAEAAGGWQLDRLLLLATQLSKHVPSSLFVPKSRSVPSTSGALASDVEVLVAISLLRLRYCTHQSRITQSETCQSSRVAQLGDSVAIPSTTLPSHSPRIFYDEFSWISLDLYGININYVNPL